ncbi:hypothetical protein [Chitinophaga sp. Cy-1792]|uniref:hypothetical protein n=1 Tax=Chitinophaga sp. Cy-1792 TaxID=2608339 RepID=UPI001423E5FF|nr:hypothetical protein [Chitinophaga sp. Cy-1792]NIG53816.1 hypothetical protein [Chitinophaga sp. Cy-1792]
MKNASLAKKGVWYGLLAHLLIILLAHVVFLLLLFRNDLRAGIPVMLEIELHATYLSFFGLLLAGGAVAGNRLAAQIIRLQGRAVAAGLTYGCLVALIIIAYGLTLSTVQIGFSLAVSLMKEPAVVAMLVFVPVWLGIALLLGRAYRKNYQVV